MQEPEARECEEHILYFSVRRVGFYGQVDLAFYSTGAADCCFCTGIVLQENFIYRIIFVITKESLFYNAAYTKGRSSYY